MRSKRILVALILATVLAIPAAAPVLGLNWKIDQKPLTIIALEGECQVDAGSREGQRSGGDLQYLGGPSSESGSQNPPSTAKPANSPDGTADLKMTDHRGPSTGVLPAPESGTIWLIGLGLSLVGFGYFRKQG